MNDIRKKIQNVRQEIASSHDEKNRKILSDIADVLDLMSDKLEEVIVNEEAMQENVQFIDDDLSGIQDELFEEVSIDDLNEMDDEYTEVKCSSCGKTVFIEKAALKNEFIPCPYCNKNIK
ncbi:CD1247 N-terminal domain-containing protein [Clostridium sp. BJN0001]|uniref:CD1247 N-terminal domain-containing protein n=1 Tax=Clostridium sp. BJN0001 TaxID=2930219 RepID=UPI001FD46838|nr:CD1247 N-terminal domain-containing protein [Clostridium sp. BJN0001]